MYSCVHVVRLQLCWEGDAVSVEELAGAFNYWNPLDSHPGGNNSRLEVIAVIIIIIFIIGLMKSFQRSFVLPS